MRIVGEIPHEACKITLYYWNNKYLIKLEKGPVEQTFKISEFDITSEEDLKEILNEEFIQKAIKRFDEMFLSLREAMKSL
jgi:hypothetical protein